jgi:hypothetical protein
MNDLTSAAANGSSKATDRRVRHGLIEDWRDGVAVLLLMLVAAFLSALAVHYWPESDDNSTHANADLSARIAALEDRLSQGKGTPEIVALKDRVTQLETRVRNTETLLAAASASVNVAAAGAKALTQTGPSLGTALSQLGTPAGTDPTRKLVDDIAARLATLEGKTATAPDEIKAAKDSIGSLTASLGELTTHVDAMAVRLARIENSDLLAMASRASLATAIANLTRAAQGSSPFKTEYDAVAALLHNDATLAAVEPYARQGLPTTGTLMGAFPELSHKAIDAEKNAQAKDWWSKVQAEFSSLVTSRPTGEATGNSTGSRLARADMRLKAGDLRAALKEVTAIPGPAHDVLKPWIEQAFARVKVESLLADLNTRAVAALAAPTTSPDGAAGVPQLPTP